MRQLLIGLTLILGAVLSLSAETALDVGRTGEITVDQQTRVGRRILRPGSYRVQHIVKNDDHVMRFSPIGEIELLYRPIEVKCVVEPAGRTVDETVARLRDGRSRAELAEVDIKGENVVHVF